MQRDIPIYVDLDGTLIQSDCLYESFFKFVREHPLGIFQAAASLFTGGPAKMKAFLARSVDLDVTALPYNEELVSWLKAQKRKGRRLALATASNQKYAESIAKHLDLFSEVLATTENLNLKGKNKAQALVDRSGAGCFDYVGDSNADINVWIHAHSAIVVSSSPRFINEVKKVANISHVLANPTKSFSLDILRPHQWAKNLLLFVPLLTSHKAFEGGPLSLSVLAFVAFCACASSVYILNDLLDIQDDRAHPTKKHRPFAAGRTNIGYSLIVMLALFAASFLLAAIVNGRFVSVLLLYYLITLAYSLWLKKLLMIDILTLASLYGVRVMSGAFAIDVALSFWLLAFSLFLFFSLATMKRYTDLKDMIQTEKGVYMPGRSYQVGDAGIMETMGITSGYASVLVMALYVDSGEVTQLYSNPTILWLVCPLLLYWISRVWFLAYRGKMHMDPVLFVIEDRISLLTFAAIGGVFLLAI